MRRNAWALEITAEAVVMHAGRSVEVHDDWLAEGAWSGDFSAEGLLASGFVCGSGAVIRDDSVHLVGPSHSIEGVYCFVEPGRVTLSNSVHLVIALRPPAMPTVLEEVRRRAHTMKLGRADYARVLYHVPAGLMMRFASGRVLVDRSDLSVREVHAGPPAEPAFHTFAGYRNLLRDTLASLVANARHPARTSPYGPLVSTVSSGYDSAACAALARELGCDGCITVGTARGGGGDSGRRVAAALGLACQEHERFGTGLESRDDPRAVFRLGAHHLREEHQDFLASVNSSEDLFFSVFEPHLAGAILFTGFHGDKVWDVGCPSGPMIVRGDASGSGLDEFRKRVGFVNVPVPYIGAVHAGQIARIGEAAEMQPYRVEGDYDRPIPRRIAEEAGVPRALFGVRKRAGSVIIADAAEARERAFNALVDEYRAALVVDCPNVRVGAPAVAG